MLNVFLIVLAFVWIVFAVIQDFKKREIADWLNFSLVIFAIGFRFFYVLFSETQNWNILYQGLIGFGIFFLLGNLFYYSRLFAGGDAKLIMALGAVLPFSDNFMANLEGFLSFLLIFFIVGTLYGFIGIFYYVFKNFKKFKKEFSKKFKKNKNLFVLCFFFVLFLMALGLSEISFLYLGVFVLVLFMFYFVAKVIDENFMVKKISVEDLSEGDWLYKNIKLNEKTIKATWDGLTKSDIDFLKKNKKKVLIRQGIPFSPVFLISFLIWVFYYGLL